MASGKKGLVSSLEVIAVGGAIIGTAEVLNPSTIGWINDRLGIDYSTMQTIDQFAEQISQHPAYAIGMGTAAVLFLYYVGKAALGK